MNLIRKATSNLVKRSLLVMGILCVCVLLLSVMAGAIYARGGLQTFPGTTAPGAHEFWDKDNAEAEFCTQCHDTIATELIATESAGTHPVTGCVDCHSFGHANRSEDCISCHTDFGGGEGISWPPGAPLGAGPGHSATPTTCANCHYNKAVELGTDAHAGFLVDLGEDATDASQSCSACHTHREINITTDLGSPLEFTQDD
jgi:hypothetical protein